MKSELLEFEINNDFFVNNCVYVFYPNLIFLLNLTHSLKNFKSV